MRIRRQDLLIYTAAALVCFSLYYWLETTQGAVWKLLLYPHARSVEIFYNLSMTYLEGIGYYSVYPTFAIGSECMGYQFILMMFAMHVCSFTGRFNGIHKLLWFFASFIGSVIVGIVTSCIRIIGSVPFVAYEKFALIHSGIGIALYFFVLVASYAGIQKWLGSVKNEKNA